MLNKKLVLGSLAGATLLVGAAMMVPSNADAVMYGVCSGCHTMHDSQNGATVANNGPNNQLLIWDGCTGCHGLGANNASGTYVGGAPDAPQVGPGAAGANMLAGGYFSATGDSLMHNVTGFTSQDATLTVAPGGGFDQAAGSGQIRCESCHGDATGGHHTYPAADVEKSGAAGDSYRMLNADAANDGTADGIVVASNTDANSDSAVWGVASDATQRTVYSGVGADLNAFCAACHSTFHTTQGSVGAWVRHPTDLDITAGGGGEFAPANDAEKLIVPVGTTDGTSAAGANEQMVMCISCHRPHGSGVSDLLRFTYSGTNNYAGDGTRSTGCETCHTTAAGAGTGK